MDNVQKSQCPVKKAKQQESFQVSEGIDEHTDYMSVNKKI